MKLLLDHLPLSLAVGAAGWWLSGDSGCLLAALLAGWMIDADHLVDFGVYLRRVGKAADYSLLKTGRYFKLNGMVVVPLHAWEITLGLGVLAILSPDSRHLLASAALAHGLHLAQDQLVYGVRRQGYWLLSRLNHGFAHKGFCE